jgi:DNA-binding SARP family transcriptional activator
LRSLIDSEPPRLITGRLDGYCLEAESCAVDAELFVRAVRSARAFPPGAEISAPALAAWRQAYEWYRGDLLGAFRYEDWCLTSRERLRDDFLDTLFHLARGALAASSYDEARQRAAQMVEIDPTEERAHRMLMRCFALLGRPAEALRQFERCRTALEEELGARPSPATFALLHAIRAGAVLDEADPAITVAATSGERR